MTLVLLLLVLRSLRRSQNAPKLFYRGLGVVVISMGLFASLSVLLLAGLMPYGSSGLATSTSSLETSATTGFREVFTVPADADVGVDLLPNINDPQAVNPQAVCPGYIASNVQETSGGFTAHLDIAGRPCNVYGNDVENLTLTVQYQANDRINLRIIPRYTGPENETWFVLPQVLIPRPLANSTSKASESTLDLSWSNSPSFSFTVKSRRTGEVLFSTKDTVLVFEDQFIEFGSALPENYNLYGLGEVIHGFRLGNNLTSEEDNLPTSSSSCLQCNI